MNHITSVEELAEILDSPEPIQHAQIMKRIKISTRDLESYISWNKQDYTRNCLVRTQKYELILLCWDIGAQAPIHGHDGKECWMYQIQGTVQEVRFEAEGETLKETNRMTLTPGKLTYMCDRMGYHTIGNISNERAITLHIYASPIDKCKVYNDQTECFELKEMSYHSMKGKELVTLVS